MMKRISIQVYIYDEDIFVPFYEGTPLAGVCYRLQEAHSCASCGEHPSREGGWGSLRWEGGLPSIVTAVLKDCSFKKLTPVFVVEA